MHRNQADRAGAQTEQALIGSKTGNDTMPHAVNPQATALSERFPFLEPSPHTPGLGLMDHYEVQDVLGEGGMGIVFKAQDLHLQRMVALKIMKPMSSNTAARLRFMHEARAMASLRSDNIVVIHQVGEYKHVPYLAMELLEGQSMEQWLANNPVMPIATLIQWAIDICNGLSPAHDKHLIHRDIKPANLWLDSAADRIKLLDFGLAYAMDSSSRHTQTGHVIGTLEYMAPEVFDCGAITYKFDLFSLGCVLYQLASNVSPFAAASQLSAIKNLTSKTPAPLQQIRHDMPYALGQLINQMLSKEPDKRPNSAREVCQRLQQIGRQLEHGTSLAVVPPAPAAHGAKRTAKAGGRARRQPEKTGRNHSVVWLALVAALVAGYQQHQPTGLESAAITAPALVADPIAPTPTGSTVDHSAAADASFVAQEPASSVYPGGDTTGIDTPRGHEAEPPVLAVIDVPARQLTYRKVQAPAEPAQHNIWARQEGNTVYPPPHSSNGGAGATRPPPPPHHHRPPPGSRPPPPPYRR